jgi:DNA polymerase-3 subunit delta'
MIYSWHTSVWSSLFEHLGQLPHALLLAGPSGGGKLDFAKELAARLLCERASGHALACGRCPSCNWFSGGNHPDFRMIEPGGDDPEETETGVDSTVQKKKSEQIRISQIRALGDFLGIGTHRQGARIIIIQPAEAMNPATANSLLKMLEEPPSSTLFILITNNRMRLLPTILSRCRTLAFPKPPKDEALAWLREGGTSHAEDLLAHAGGMPLAARNGAEDWDRLDGFYRDLAQLEHTGPVAVAGRWESWLKENKEGDTRVDKRTLVIWMQKWVFDLAAMKLCGRAFFHAHRAQEIRAAAKRASVDALIDCYNDLLRIRAVSQHPLNPRLFLEDLLSRYARAALSGR